MLFQYVNIPVLPEGGIQRTVDNTFIPFQPGHRFTVAVLNLDVRYGLMLRAVPDAGDDAGAVFRVAALILPVAGDRRRQ